MNATVRSRAVLHRGRVFTTARVELALPDGSEIVRDVVEHPGAVAILPVMNDGRLVLLRQWRFPVGETLWEIPAGTLEPGEDPAACARRELIEEAGVEAREWTALGDLFPAPGYSSERIRVYLARDLAEVGRSHADDDEFIEPVPCDLAKVVDLVRTGELRDGKTLGTLAMAWAKGVLGR